MITLPGNFLILQSLLLFMLSKYQPEFEISKYDAKWLNTS